MLLSQLPLLNLALILPITGVKLNMQVFSVYEVLKEFALFQMF